jgi:putative ATP-dependent endonuclease of OLD family
MRVSRLKIENFRGVKEAELYFSGHTLLIGGNNVGKSTVCEALDLVLGPDRLNRTSPVEEFDFRNANYLAGGAYVPHYGMYAISKPGIKVRDAVGGR